MTKGIALNIELSTGQQVVMRKITNYQIIKSAKTSEGDALDFFDYCISNSSKLQQVPLTITSLEALPMKDYFKLQSAFSKINGWPVMENVFLPKFKSN